MKSLRAKQLRCGYYWDGVMDHGRIVYGSPDCEANIVCVHWHGLIAGTGRVHESATSRGQAQLSQYSWVYTSATCTGVDQSLYLNRFGNRLFCCNERDLPGLADAYDRKYNEAPVWGYLTGEVWQGTSREMKCTCSMVWICFTINGSNPHFS